jgi:hypothetical protein
MREDGDHIPAPLVDLPRYQDKTADAIRDGSIDRIFPWPIRLFPAAGRSVRVQITMDSQLLSRIDEVTSNRSRFLADAATDRLKGL